MAYPHYNAATIDSADPTTLIENRDDAVLDLNQIILEVGTLDSASEITLYDAPDGTDSADLDDFRTVMVLPLTADETIERNKLKARLETDLIAEADGWGTDDDIETYVDGDVVTSNG